MLLQKAPPIKARRVARWGWTAPRWSKHLWGVMLWNHTAHKKAEMRMMTLPLLSSSGCCCGWCIMLIISSVAMFTSHNVGSGQACCWCCRAHRDVLMLWDHGKWMNKIILTISTTITAAKENIIYILKRSILMARCPGGERLHSIKSSKLSIKIHKNEHGWNPELDAE